MLPDRLGDVIAGLMSMSIIKTAGTVSGGLDKGYRNKMVRNVAIEVAIGLVPLLGDFIDTFFQANTRNAKLLEDMLTARVLKLEEAEMSGHTSEDDDHSTRRRIDAPTPAQSQYRKARPAAIDAHHHATDRHRDERSRIRTPPRHDDRHAGAHERLQSKGNKAPTKPKNASGTDAGGGWLNRFQSRGKQAGANRNDDHRRTSNEEVAPTRPPRPATNQQTGSF